MIEGTIVVLTGGVGGAKLVAGLADIVAPESMTAIVNTADDFTHLGLHISPDIDTLIYTLAGLANPKLGWGRADETWNFMEALTAIGGEDWFSLGDRDLAMHVERTRKLKAGEPLSAITRSLAAALGVKANIAPMTDQPVSTHVHTDSGTLAFQDYFVRQKCAPRVRSIAFTGADLASPSPRALAALRADDLAAIVIAPSNPWLSIDPILAVPGLAETLRSSAAPVVAVTPLPGGKAVKGPTAKIMEELGIPLNVQSIAAHYGSLIDGLLIDLTDPEPDGIAFARHDTIMKTHEDRVSVARAVIDLAGSL